MSRLKKKYFEKVLPTLQEKYKDRNIFEIPRLKKIVISMGLGEAVKDKGLIEGHIKELSLISGQKPVVTRSRKAISNFKLRENQIIGLKVTMRGKRMYDFLDRFCNIASPRIRDFRGFSRKADGRGNYSVGLEDQQIFSEINLDEVKRSQGMNVAFVTTAEKDADCIELLTQMGFPFKEA